MSFKDNNSYLMISIKIRDVDYKVMFSLSKIFKFHNKTKTLLSEVKKNSKEVKFKVKLGRTFTISKCINK